MKNDISQKLISYFAKFPGIGPRQAERFVHFIAKSDDEFVKSLITSMDEFKKSINKCPTCYMYHTEKSAICRFCSNENRDKSLLVIVEKESDIYAIEESGAIDGKYFVLGGCIPIATDNENYVRVEQLLKHLSNGFIKGVILAFSAHPDADHTTFFLSKKIKELNKDIKVEMLGRGLSSGSEIAYSDPETIKNAFSRKQTT